MAPVSVMQYNYLLYYWIIIIDVFMCKQDVNVVVTRGGATKMIICSE